MDKYASSALRKHSRVFLLLITFVISELEKIMSSADDISVPIRIDMGGATSVQTEIQLRVSKKVLE